MSAAELRSMAYDKLVKLAHSLGIGVTGLKKRNQVLTRLMESVVDATMKD